MLNMLLASFPESGLKLYKEMDYWQCKDLLDIYSSSKSSPADRLQLYRNTVFNEFLNSIAYRKLQWQFLSEKYNLFQIKEQTEQLGKDE